MRHVAQMTKKEYQKQLEKDKQRLDCIAKGRHASQKAGFVPRSGSSHPFFKLSRAEQEKFFYANRKLTDEQIKVVMRLHFVFGVPCRELRQLFGLSRSTMLRLKNGESFPHITKQATQLLQSIGEK